MNKQMKFGFTGMALGAVLLATVAVLPLKYAGAQNATMSLPGAMMTRDMIKAKMNQMRSEHPELAPVLDKVQSLDVPQTLKTLIGALELQDVLIAHGRLLVLQKALAGAMQNATTSG